MSDPAPIAIGGVGGSGTRVVARILGRLGFFMGDDLNEAWDNLTFTLLFTRPGVPDLDDAAFAQLLDTFTATMLGRDFSAEQRALIERAAADERFRYGWFWRFRRAQWALDPARRFAAAGAPWGWKEPQTHVVIDRLRALLPRLRYVHVARNGLDMAYSANQGQPRLWGERFLGTPVGTVDPRTSLRFWCAVHRRVLEIGRAMGDDFYVLDYDRLCADPAGELAALISFAGCDPDDAQRASVAAEIKPPSTIGRFAAHGLDAFDPADVDYVASLGFTVR